MRSLLYAGFVARSSDGETVVDAIDRLTTTVESHDRVIVVEVMGRAAAKSLPAHLPPLVAAGIAVNINDG